MERSIFMAKLREKLWVWGHPTNAFMNRSGITTESHMSPREGIIWLGGENVFYVPSRYEISRREQAEYMKDMRNVGFALNTISKNPENFEEILQLGRDFDNVKIGILDDFFNAENTDNYLNYSIETLKGYADRLHAVGMELWMVVYSKHFREESKPNCDMREYFKVFDGITFWFWNESEIEFYEKRMQDFFDATEGIRRMVGCYLYNFGDEIPSNIEPTIYQLKRGLDFLKEGKIEGLIMHTNCVLDIGHKVPIEAKNWLANHLDDELPD